EAAHDGPDEELSQEQRHVSRNRPRASSAAYATSPLVNRMNAVSRFTCSGIMLLTRKPWAMSRLGSSETTSPLAGSMVTSIRGVPLCALMFPFLIPFPV